MISILNLKDYYHKLLQLEKVSLKEIKELQVLFLPGKNKSKDATAKSAEQQKSAKPRLALPKGANRPGNLKIDHRPGEEKGRQSTFSDFSKQASAGQQALSDAER